MNKRKSIPGIYPYMLIIIFLCIHIQVIHAQHKFSLMPGLFYNGNTFDDDVSGLGLIMGLEYIPRENSLFSVELRTKWGYYDFDDGTKWHQDKDGTWQPPINPGEPRLEYSLFSPQLGIVPKCHWHLDDELSLFVENEFVVGLMTGKFKFKTGRKVTFTEPIFCYNVGIGAEYRFSNWAMVGALTLSTLNFRKNISKHKPYGYEEKIPDQDAIFLVTFIFKIPL